MIYIILVSPVLQEHVFALGEMAIPRNPIAGTQETHQEVACRVLLWVCTSLLMSWEWVTTAPQNTDLFRGMAGSLQELQSRLLLVASILIGIEHHLTACPEGCNRRDRIVASGLAAPSQHTEHSQEWTPPLGNHQDIPPGWRVSCKACYCPRGRFCGHRAEKEGPAVLLGIAKHSG